MKAKKAIPCTLIINAPKTGHIFTPIECDSINQALTIAKEWGFPYRIFSKSGALLRRGWRC